jgi:hypothetical protein
MSQAVNKADVHVAAAANSKAYGQTANGTGTPAGGVNGDGITASFSGPGDAASAPVGSGSYAVTATPSGPDGKPGNYAVHETDATLTVNPAGLTVTAGGQSMTYGGGVPALTCECTGLVSGDASASFTGGPAATATSGSTAGSYPSTQGTLAATGSYTTGASDGGTPAANPATLTATAEGASRY